MSVNLDLNKTQITDQSFTSSDQHSNDPQSTNHEPQLDSYEQTERAWYYNLLDSTVGDAITFQLYKAALPIIAIGALTGCGEPEDTQVPDTNNYPEPVDNDGDGYYACPRDLSAQDLEGCRSLLNDTTDDDPDCDDSNATINPGESEICDNVDNNCNVAIDENPVDANVWYLDNDGDTFGDPNSGMNACTRPDGYVSADNGFDCDDTDAGVTLGSTWYLDYDGDGLGDINNFVIECEQPSGYVENADDCDDLDASITDGYTWYRDADGDSYGDPTNTVVACEITDGSYVSNSSDCDDTDASLFEETEWYVDADNDGFGDEASYVLSCGEPIGANTYVTNADDCNDSSALAYPGAEEICDGIDNDCNETVDDDYATDATTWYADADSDGYGDPTISDTQCTIPAGYVSNQEDCNDTNAAISPAASEQCDGIDNNCSGIADEGLASYTLYYDGDSDGYGDYSASMTSCYSSYASYVSDYSDCDDGDATVNPGMTETIDYCEDGIDQNCDGVDVSCGAEDADGDGFSVDDGDCDDYNAAINPDATEVCDGVDNNCSGVADDGLASYTLYHDGDADGYGDLSSSMTSCYASYTSYVSNATDCDDEVWAVNPAATEICDGVDNDCSGIVDDGYAADVVTWYADTDSDGYGDVTNTTLACTMPTGYVAVSTDCDDADSSIYPGAYEYCDGIDNDCNSTVDDDYAVDTLTWYADIDGDNYGDVTDYILSCESTEFYTSQDSSDCDDADAAIHPNATEYCGGTDYDCDGLVNESDSADATTWYADADSDGYGDPTISDTQCTIPAGYVSNQEDCNDTNATIHPSATEYCGDVDHDCDGLVNEADSADALTWYADADSDGYGDPTISDTQCTIPAGYVSNQEDCDDASAAIHPGATEYCGTTDHDCDGLVNESDSADVLTWYADADGDTYGNASDYIQSCLSTGSYTSNDATDCDDTDATTNPSATEVCDYTDNDCDDEVDEGLQAWYYDDLDGDGYGSASTATQLCPADSSGMVGDGSDCEDTDSFVYPGAAEMCGDGVVNDCEDTDGSEAMAACGMEDMSLADEDFGVSATTNYAGTGWALGASDLNGDGFDELLVGAPQTALTSGGGVYVLYGSASGLSTTGYAYMSGASAGDMAGYSVAGVGDTDGDGYEEVLVGALYESTNGTYAGAAYLVDGDDVATSTITSIDSAAMYGVSAGDGAGGAVAGLGDVSGDGVVDIAIAADSFGSSDNGAVYVNFGPVTGDFTLDSSDITISGENNYDYTGTAIAGGDVNGDGINDLLIGSKGGDRADLFYGPLTAGAMTTASSDVVFYGEMSGDDFGKSVAIAYDVDGDGFGDVLIGAPEESSVDDGNGAVYLFLGSDVLSSSLTASLDSYAKITGSEQGSWAGVSVVAADINGDMLDDILVGANGGGGLDYYSTWLGGVFVYSSLPAGTVTTDDADIILEGDNQSDLAGSAVGSGDFDNDGVDDVSVGAPAYDSTRTDAGRTYVVYGSGI